MPQRKIIVRLEQVKLTRGHDGFLRGKPEPVVMFAAYAVGDAKVKLLKHAWRGLHISGSYPITCEPPEKLLLQSTYPARTRRIVLLGIAMELDKGSDVLAVRKALPDAERWGLWDRSSPLAVPFSLMELGLLNPYMAPQATSVHLKYQQEDLREICKTDDWVGASLVLLEPAHGEEDQWRMRFVSDDRRNDWLATVSIRL